MMWSDYNNLSDIYHILSGFFEDNMRLNICVHDILDLSYDEYMILVDRIKHSDSIETVQHFSLCLFVAWVTAYKINRSDEYYKFMKGFISHMPQHHAKIALDAINTACYDFQIDTFGRSLNSLRDIKRIVKIHAGFTEPD